MISLLLNSQIAIDLDRFHPLKKGVGLKHGEIKMSCSIPCLSIDKLSLPHSLDMIFDNYTCLF